MTLTNRKAKRKGNINNIGGGVFFPSILCSASSENEDMFLNSVKFDDSHPLRGLILNVS